MSTIIDLNTARTITYNDEASYAISFGTNLGNITANLAAYNTANITQQTSLNSITSPVRDLLIDLQFSNVGNVSMAYVGTYSNIGLLQTAPAAWRVNGIRSVAQYTEAFANVKFTDLTGASNITPEYSYVTTVNDQSGNTRTWTTTVNVVTQPAVSITGNVIYNEDTLANVTIANVVVDPTSVVTFRLYANTIPTYGSMTDGVITGNSIFIDGNATSLNTQIAANALKFLPASDLASNVANAISFAIGNTTTIYSTSNANIQIANTHSEYSFPGGTYTEDTRLAFGNTITDLDTRALSFTVGIQQTAGNTGQFYVSNSLVGNANTQLNITNSRAAINGTIEWMPPVDYTGNVSFTYNQVKTLATGNVTQASNVVANFTAVTNPEISNMTARTVLGNVVSNIFANTTPYINDGPDYGQLYTITLNSARGNFGTNIANALLQNTFTSTGNTTTINNLFGNIVFVPAPNATSGNFVYTQSRDGVAQANITANLTVTPNALTPSTQTFTANGNVTLDFAQSYWGNIRILTVGGGGAGSGKQAFSSTLNSAGAGGAGGEAVEVNASYGTANALSQGTYNVIVGSGAANTVTTGNALSGTSSYISQGANVYFTAAGGQGGLGNGDGGGITSSTAPGYANLYINTNSPNPPNSGNKAYIYGGAGGAAGGTPSPSFYTVELPAGVFHNWYGNPAPGYVSNISGANVYYGAGGGGGQPNIGSPSGGQSGNDGGGYGGGGGGQGGNIGKVIGTATSGVVIIKIT